MRVLSESFIPPVIDCLPALAAGDASIEQQCAERGLTLSVELERRVAIAFQVLGLEVNSLGQGAGRVADGVAWCRPGRWAVVYDTKVRRGGFVMGTEDRKFREYIERHGKDLGREGIDAIYFAVISSSFEESDLLKAHEVVRLTKAKAFVLLEASGLRQTRSPLAGDDLRRRRGTVLEAAGRRSAGGIGRGTIRFVCARGCCSC